MLTEPFGLSFSEAVLLAARVMEVGGILVMLLGPPVAIALSLGRREQITAYRAFRQHLGRAILLGLEFLVAADIIRTVSEAPTLEDVIVLGLIVLIRTFLSFTLQLELEGRWPWQRLVAAGTDAEPS
jgi:uncharacterized membrane protein